MVIHKVNSDECKDGRQHWYIVHDCQSHWCRLNNKDYTYYEDIMNMNYYIWNDEHRCLVTLTYLFNLNKW